MLMFDLNDQKMTTLCYF